MAQHRRATPTDIEDDTPQAQAAREAFGRDLYELNVQQYCCAGLNFGYYYADSPLMAYDDEAAPARTQLDRGTFSALAAGMMPGVRVTEAVYRERYDAFYYSVGAVAPKRMPVLLVKFDDPDRTWYYLDPYTGGILRRYDRYGRVMRWLVNGLHTLDFPFLFEHRPAWDLTIILLSAGGLALSLTGLIIGWRRVSPSGVKPQKKAA